MHSPRNRRLLILSIGIGLVAGLAFFASSKKNWIHHISWISEWDGYRAVDHSFFGGFGYYDSRFDKGVVITPIWLKIVTPTGIHHMAGFSPGDSGAKCLHLWHETSGHSYRLIQHAEVPPTKVIAFYQRQLKSPKPRFHRTTARDYWSLEGTCPDGKTSLAVVIYRAPSARRATYLITWIPPKQ